MSALFLLTISAGIVVIFVLKIIQKILEIRHLPPGPWGLPVVGYLPFLQGKEIVEVFRELGQKYGPIFSMKLGGKLVVVLNDYTAVKDSVIRQAEIFSGRPNDMLLFTNFNKGRGIVPSEGEQWKIIRRFSLSSLRDFGFGKRSLEGKIQEEVDSLRKEFAKFGNRRFSPVPLLMNAVSNVICSIVFGERFDYEDEEFKTLIDLVYKTLTVKFAGNVLNFLPWLKVLPSMQREMDKIWQLAQETHDHIGKLVENHTRKMEQTAREEGFEPTDFLQALVVESQGNSQKARVLSESLRFVINQLFIAGTDTTAATTEWAFLICILYPEIQSKVQSEIDSVVGRDRLPSLEDRNQMPYTEAFLQEIQRFASIVPLALPHSNMEEATVLGYTIPKRSLVLPNLRNIHKDPRYWPDPETFDPSRFLTQDGRVDYKKPSFFPFCAGKRICAGESLARTEMFLFVTGIMQHLTIKNPANEKLPSPRWNGEGVTVHPLPFDICVEPRK